MNNNQYAQDVAKAIEEIDKTIAYRKRFDSQNTAFSVHSNGKTPMADLLIKRDELTYILEGLEHDAAPPCVVDEINDWVMANPPLAPIAFQVRLNLHNRKIGEVKYVGTKVDKIEFEDAAGAEKFGEWLDFCGSDANASLELLNGLNHMQRGYVELSTLMPPVPAVPSRRQREVVPPISKSVWQRNRLMDLNAGIQRYIDANLCVPAHLAEERNELLEQGVKV